MNTSFKLKHFAFLALIFGFFTPTYINAQAMPIIAQSSSLNVHGTSNVHDWDMKPTTISGILALNNSKEISAIQIKIAVNSLKSKSSIMDGKTYDAFDFKNNPNITFLLTDTVQEKLSENDQEVTLTGNLSLHGQTRKINIKAMAKITKSGDYQLKATVPLRMTDYKIKPPTAFMGTMKTGDEVTIKFDVSFKG